MEGNGIAVDSLGLVPECLVFYDYVVDTYAGSFSAFIFEIYIALLQRPLPY